MTFKTLLRNFEAAVRADEMVGASHPLDRNAIRLNYKRHKRAIAVAIAQLDIGNYGVKAPKPVVWPTPEEIEQFSNE